MNDPTATTGTTAGGADGSAVASGTTLPPAADGSASDQGAHPSLEHQLAEERRKNAQLLSEKTNTERLRLEAEAALGRQNLSPTSGGDQERQAREIANRLQLAANSGDEYAAVIIGMGQAFQYELGQIKRDTSVARISDAKMRETTESVLKEMPGVPVNVAEEIARGRVMAQREAELAAREKAVRDAEEARRNGVVGATFKPVLEPVAGAATDNMKRSDYLALRNKLESEGRWKERDALIDRKQNGALTLIDG